MQPVSPVTRQAGDKLGQRATETRRYPLPLLAAGQNLQHLLAQQLRKVSWVFLCPDPEKGDAELVTRSLVRALHTQHGDEKVNKGSACKRKFTVI